VIPSISRLALPYRLINPSVLNVTSFIDVGSNGRKIGKGLKRETIDKFYTAYENISLTSMLRKFVTYYRSNDDSTNCNVSHINNDKTKKNDKNDNNDYSIIDDYENKDNDYKLDIIDTDNDNNDDDDDDNNDDDDNDGKNIDKITKWKDDVNPNDIEINKDRRLFKLENATYREFWRRYRRKVKDLSQSSSFQYDVNFEKCLKLTCLKLLERTDKEHYILFGSILGLWLLGDCEEFKVITDFLDPHVILTRLQLARLYLESNNEQLIAPVISTRSPNERIINERRMLKQKRSLFIGNDSENSNLNDSESSNLNDSESSVIAGRL